MHCIWRGGNVSFTITVFAFCIIIGATIWVSAWESCTHNVTRSLTKSPEYTFWQWAQTRYGNNARSQRANPFACPFQNVHFHWLSLRLHEASALHQPVRVLTTGSRESGRQYLLSGFVIASVSNAMIASPYVCQFIHTSHRLDSVATRYPKVAQSPWWAEAFAGEFLPNPSYIRCG